MKRSVAERRADKQVVKCRLNYDSFVVSFSSLDIATFNIPDIATRPASLVNHLVGGVHFILPYNMTMRPHIFCNVVAIAHVAYRTKYRSPRSILRFDSNT